MSKKKKTIEEVRREVVDYAERLEAAGDYSSLVEVFGAPDYATRARTLADDEAIEIYNEYVADDPDMPDEPDPSRVFLLVAEIRGCITDDDAQEHLDAFRESVNPSSEYDITLARATIADVGRFDVCNVGWLRRTVDGIPGPL